MDALHGTTWIEREELARKIVSALRDEGLIDFTAAPYPINRALMLIKDLLQEEEKD